MFQSPVSARRGGRFALLVNYSIRVVNVLCLVIGGLALLLMVGVVAVEIVLRSFFATSTHMSDEYAGYALVAMTLMSLGTCQLNGKFPRVEVIVGALPQQGARALEILFDIVTVALAALLLWKLTEFHLASVRSGDVAPTLTATPLWIPKLALVVGTAAYLMAALQTLAVHLLNFNLAADDLTA